MRLRTIWVTILLVALGGQARAEDDISPGGGQGAALGLEIDLLPTVLSVAAGKFGGSANLWVGYDHLKFRAVGSHLYFPSGFLMPEGFNFRELTVVAGIVDYFFLPRFSGPWIGTGFEYWWNTVGSPNGPNRAAWNSAVYTLGAGYVWKFWGNVYLNPWVAAHLIFSTPEISLYGATWKPSPFAFEISLKIGGFFSL